MPTLIKAKETVQINQHFYVEKIFQNCAILQEKAKCVCIVSHFLPKRLFFLLLFKPLLQSILTRGTSHSLIKVSSYQMRYLLSNMTGGFRSYLRTTKRVSHLVFYVSSYILVLRLIGYVTRRSGGKPSLMLPLQINVPAHPY